MMIYNKDEKTGELYHYGIKGQRWGVRRYQNEDGSYTSEGKQRYGINSDGRMSKEGKRIYRADKKVDRAATKATKNYNKSINTLKVRSEAKTGYGRSRLATKATDEYYRATKAHAKANRLSQRYTNKFGYKQEQGMMDDMSKTGFKASTNFRKTTTAERRASVATSAAITTGTFAAAAFLGLPFYIISVPRSSTYEYRLKDEDKKVKIKDL